MKVLLLGGGAQGRAAFFDLLQNKDISLVVADNDLGTIRGFISDLGLDVSGVEFVEVDANNRDDLVPLFSCVDLIIDLLPTIFRKFITSLAIETKTNVVNTSFHSHISELANDIFSAGIVVFPEAGLDPGIDLVLAGHGVSLFDDVSFFSSACGGVPELEFCDNPINYKISWNFEGVLSAYKRPANIIRDGLVVDISSDNIFDFGSSVFVDGVGSMDMYPNGFTSTYASLLGLNDVKDMGRYTLRWPGHCDFWKKIVGLGLIDDDPVLGVSPRSYFAKVAGSRLQYLDGERDLVVLRNEFRGFVNGKFKTLVQTLVDSRDLGTGLMAMNRTVGFTASIIAQMILRGDISGVGLLSPTKDVPFDLFVDELEKRKIKIKQEFV